MKTLAQIAEENGCSKSLVRKFLLQGRLTSGGKPVRTERVGNVVTLPDDTKMPTERAEYGSLKKNTKKARSRKGT